MCPAHEVVSVTPLFLGIEGSWGDLSQGSGFTGGLGFRARVPGLNPEEPTFLFPYISPEKGRFFRV